MRLFDSYFISIDNRAERVMVDIQEEFKTRG